MSIEITTSREPLPGVSPHGAPVFEVCAGIPLPDALARLELLLDTARELTVEAVSIPGQHVTLSAAAMSLLEMAQALATGCMNGAALAAAAASGQAKTLGKQGGRAA